MSAGGTRSDDGRHPNGDSPRSGRGRAIVWFAVAAAAIAALAVAGWYVFDRWQAARAAARDARVAGDLHYKLAVANQPLSDDEFGAALSLCDAADAETRFTALLAATADAIRHHPERKARVIPVAARLVGAPEPAVRAKAIKALAGLRSREHIELIRPSLRAADPRERTAAEEAIAVLEAAGPPE
jgi:hypothetical protein